MGRLGDMGGAHVDACVSMMNAFDLMREIVPVIREFD
jgi:hypothetical protein